MSDKKRYTVYLEGENKKFMEQKAMNEHMSYTDIVRNLIRKYREDNDG